MFKNKPKGYCLMADQCQNERGGKIKSFRSVRNVKSCTCLPASEIQNGS